MTKSIKFFSAALAVMALASCSNDDELSNIGIGAQKPATGDLVVTFDPFEGDALTRAYRGEGSATAPGNLFFVEDDVISVWNDVFTANDFYSYQEGKGFMYDSEGDPMVDVKEGETFWALFPNKSLQRAYYDRATSSRIAEFAIPHIITYDKNSEIDMDGEGTLGYVCDLPAFGTVTLGEGGNLKTNLRSLTALVGLDLTNTYSHITWLKISVAAADKYISGTFAATLTSDPNTYKECKLEVGKSDLEKYKEIYIDLRAVPSPHSFIYFPLLAGIDVLKDNVKIEYTTSNTEPSNIESSTIKWQTVGAVFAAVPQDKQLLKPHQYITVGYNYVYEALSPNQISQILEQYKDSKADITLDIEETLNVDANGTTKGYGYNIVLPDFTNDINVTINLKDAAVISDAETNTKPLTIKNADGASFTGTVTLNVGSLTGQGKTKEATNTVAGVTVNVPEGTVVLAGDYDKAINTAGEMNLVAAKKVVLGKKGTVTKVGVTSKTAATLKEIGKDVKELEVAENATVATITLAENANSASGVVTNVAIAGKVVGDVTFGDYNFGTLTLTTGDDLSVAAATSIDRVVTGNVTVWDNVEIALGKEAVAVAGTLTMRTAGRTLNLKAGYVNTLAVDLTDNIGVWEKPMITVQLNESNGCTAISKLTDKDGIVKFTESLWNGVAPAYTVAKATTGFAAGTYAYAATIYNAEITPRIYTATQLAALSATTVQNAFDAKAGTKVAIANDLDLNENKTWVSTSLTLAEVDGTYLGNSLNPTAGKKYYTISNVGLTPVAKGLFTTVKSTTNSSQTVKNLIIDGVTLELMSNNKPTFGSLAANVETPLTVENVEVNNIDLTWNDAYVNGTTGGLVGENTAALTVKTVKVNGNITGYANLGGYVGKAGADVRFEGSVPEVNVSNKAGMLLNEYDIEVAKIGAYVGSAFDTNKDINIVIKGGDCSQSIVTHTYKANEKVLNNNAGSGNTWYFNPKTTWVGFSGVGTEGPATYSSKFTGASINASNDNENKNVPKFTTTNNDALYYFATTVAQ